MSSPPRLPTPSLDSSSSTKSAIIISTEPVLPLRPTFRERFTHATLRLFPQPYYLHPLLTRSRIAIALLSLLLLLLLLTILLPALLLTHHRSGGGGGGAGGSFSLPTGVETYYGDGTYYGPGLGACGIVSNSEEMIVAVSWQLYDFLAVGTPAVANPNLNPVCGRKIRARRVGKEGGVEVKVVDRCVGCKPNDLDFSPAAFKGVGEEWEGRVGIEWAWV